MIASANNVPHAASLAPPWAQRLSPDQQSRLFDQTKKALFRRDAEFAYGSHDVATNPATDLVDFLFATGQTPPAPAEVFPRLRWGGQFVYVAHDAAQVGAVARNFNDQAGFVLQKPPALFHPPLFGFLPLPMFTQPVHYFIARKTALLPPGQISERFTYHVELLQHARFGNDYVVMKQVPTFDRVLARLREKFPDSPRRDLERRAHKFTDKVFPVFLTREAGILRILQENLPPKFQNRVPKLLAVEKDAHGFVRTLYMNWLRNARPNRHALTQLEFAHQAAELLAALHDSAKVIHLDLRLDNVVITREGVGFVDFGSAVRVGECLQESTLLTNLFEEMMRTSQIQRMLGKMQDTGLVTSPEIRNSYHKVDKAVDFFYLAVQITSPHGNPDLKGLIAYDRDSEEARQLSALTADILRPRELDNPTFRSARDILHGILEIERHIGYAARPEPAPASPIPEPVAS